MTDDSDLATDHTDLANDDTDLVNELIVIDFDVDVDRCSPEFLEHFT